MEQGSECRHHNPDLAVKCRLCFLHGKELQTKGIKIPTGTPVIPHPPATGMAHLILPISQPDSTFYITNFSAEHFLKPPSLNLSSVSEASFRIKPGHVV